jgi:predicted ATPase/DNA-binding SARP family transcriptional activator/class 3 adenylate cyclase
LPWSTVWSKAKEKRGKTKNFALMRNCEENSAGMTEAESAAVPLAIRLFGPFAVWVYGVPLPRLRSRKGQWLLALLALRRGREVDRSWLAEMLWPEGRAGNALALMRRELTDLRRALGVEASRLRSPTPHTLCLDLTGAEADVAAFDAALAAGDAPALERAVALYRGPLLEGWVEDWVFQERQAREQAYLTALETLAAQALAAADPAAAERYLRRAAAVDPLRESAQRALMQALAAGGNYAAATEVYRELRRRLHRDHNAAPDPETQALSQQIRAEAREKAGARGQGSGVGAGRAPVQGTRAAAFGPADPRPLTPHPSGTVTFLFTDIEGSSRLWEKHPEAMRAALARHDALLRQAIETHAGLVFKTMGDQFCAAFASAAPAVAAAVEAQHALADVTGVQGFRGSGVQEGPTSGPEDLNTRTPEPLTLRVRMALSTGAVERRGGDYFGPALNRVARLLAAGHGGQLLLAQATAGLVREALPPEMSLRDLGAHRLKDLPQPEHIFQLLAADLQANNFPPLRSLEAFAHNLPAPLTSFIGREQAMAEVKQLLGHAVACQPSAVSPTKAALDLTDSRQPIAASPVPDGPRLLTLTGSGGCGKTRLALQVAADLLEAYADGVWLVELAALSDPALVPQTVASALGVREESGRPLTAILTDYLRPKQVLVILDNCEHLLTACAQLADALLRGCPQLRILASSREGLGIGGEQTYRVPSLSLPPAEGVGGWGLGVGAGLALPNPQAPAPNPLMQFEAIRLFADRARLSQATFAVTQANAPAVAQVCQRLDGIPLAIELAAARVRALPVEQIDERLDDMFRLLTGGSRAALPRQQTLRALIDWSYDLLSPPERVLLQRLSVFARGCTLAAAEAVCSDFGFSILDFGLPAKSKTLEDRRPLSDPIQNPNAQRAPEIQNEEVLDLLMSLVDKSLVQYEQRGEQARYWLLETVRQYGRARLLEVGEAEVVRGRHADYFLQLAEQAEPELRGPGQNLRADRLEAEHDNLRAALTWFGSAAEGAEGQMRLAGALDFFWFTRGHFREGRQWAEAALSRGREASAPVRAKALRAAGHLALFTGDYAAAGPLLAESVALARAAGQRWEVAFSLFCWALLAIGQGDDERATVHAQESRTLAEDVGDPWLRSRPVVALGLVALHQGDGVSARAFFEEALAMAQSVGDRWHIARLTANLGAVALQGGECEQARALYQEALVRCQEVADKRAVVGCLFGLAAVAAQAQLPTQWAAAARLFGAAEALREAMGAHFAPFDAPPGCDRNVAAIRAQLSDEAIAAAWTEGRAMSLEQAVSYALGNPA